VSEGGLEQQQLVLSSRRKFAKYFFAKKMLSFWCWTNSLYSSFHILLLFVLFLLSEGEHGTNKVLYGGRQEHEGSGVEKQKGETFCVWPLQLY